MAVKVKICGVTAPEDARGTAEAGADAIGLNFVPSSPRFLRKHETALVLMLATHGKGVLRIGVFADAPAVEILAKVDALGLEGVQLHGSETPALAKDLRSGGPPGLQIWKAFRVGTRADLDALRLNEWPCDAVLFDTSVKGALGGTGRSFDWSILEGFRPPVPLVLAGGLHPGNVDEAVRRVQPAWVDTASGVEAEPGHKDLAKVREFVTEAKRICV